MFDLASHRDAVRRTCVVFLAALGLVVASSLAGVLVEAQAATEADCIDEFNDSAAAANSCGLTFTIASGDDCGFEGTCLYEKTVYDAAITVHIDDADDLVNCYGSLATSC